MEKYIIDRIEDKIIVLENLKTKEILEVPLEYIKSAHEGAVVKKIGEEFIIIEAEEEQRRKMIREKMDRLKRRK